MGRYVTRRAANIEDQLWTRFYRQETMIAQSRRCYYCEQPLTAKTATADHVIARINGGTTNRLNIKAACYECNQCKGSRPERAFRAMIQNPKTGDGIHVFLANFRYRLWSRTWRAKQRLERMVA